MSCNHTGPNAPSLNPPPPKAHGYAAPYQRPLPSSPGTTTPNPPPDPPGANPPNRTPEPPNPNRRSEFAASSPQQTYSRPVHARADRQMCHAHDRRRTRSPVQATRDRTSRPEPCAGQARSPSLCPEPGVRAVRIRDRCIELGVRLTRPEAAESSSAPRLVGFVTRGSPQQRICSAQLRPTVRKGVPHMTAIATASAEPPARRRCGRSARVRRHGRAGPSSTRSVQATVASRPPNRRRNTHPSSTRPPEGDTP